MQSLPKELERDVATSCWNGFSRHDFQLHGVRCITCEPHTARSDRAWIWRARFFDAWPAVDLALLAEGFHVAHTDVADLFGNHDALERWDRFYDLLVNTLHLHPRPILEGFSRGGLIVYNWGGTHPDRVGCIYADAPVCDIRSWPGGKGCGDGSPDAWNTCLKAYGIADAPERDVPKGPLDSLSPLAQAGIPIIHVCGDADTTVPYAENTGKLENIYRKIGGSITVIRKPACGHHPHSLQDPSRIVNFILRNRLA